jgi:tetratricopeptide (TPR) repeat protein
MLALQPDTSVGEWLLGTAHLRLGAYVEALVHLDRSLTLNPRLGPAMVMKAMALHQLGRSEEALRAVLENVVIDERMARILLCFLQDALFGNAMLKEKLVARYVEWKRVLSAAIAKMYQKDEKQSMVFSELLFSVLESFTVRAALSQRLPDCGSLARALSMALTYA